MSWLLEISKGILWLLVGLRDLRWTAPFAVLLAIATKPRVELALGFVSIITGIHYLLGR